MFGGVIIRSQKILGTDITKCANIFCLNSHFLSQFMMKRNFYQNICFLYVLYWCL